MPKTIDEENPYEGRLGAIYLDERLTPEQAEQIGHRHPSLKWLGEGVQGIAYQFGEESIPGDPLMKLTISTVEFETAQKIMKLQKKFGGKIPGVVQIFNARKLTDNLVQNVYEIYLERVRNLNETEEKIVAKLYFYKLGQLPKKMYNLIRNIRGRFPDVSREEYLDVVRKFLRLVRQLEFIDPIGKGSNEFWDLEGFNVGVEENGEYVLLDIGGMQL